MAGTGVGKFSSTAGSNTSNLTVNFAENMAPSNVNNAARELMGHIRDMYEQLGDGYFEFGDGDGEYTVARSDADTITITSSSDISSVYFAGRKIRITDGGSNVVEGTIASSSHTSTTQTVNLTGISLASGTPTKVELGVDTAAFGGRLILDDDGDTYIEAVTDDTIDIYLAGAKDFTFTANTFTAHSGSNVDFDGDLDVDGTTNLDVVDIDGAVDMASTLQVDGSITSSDGMTITTNDTSDTLTLLSGDTGSSSAPNLLFNRNSGSPAANDFLGSIDFQGKNSAGDDHNYIRILSRILSPTDGSETADLVFKDALGNNILNMAASEVVFNDDSIDRDFRVESNGNANMIFVDGGSDHVNIGTATDLGGTLNVSGTGFFQTADNTDTLTLNSTDDDANVGPVLRLRRDTSSPADDDLVGAIHFSADNSNGSNLNIGSITTILKDVTGGTVDGVLGINVIDNDTFREFVRFQGSVGTVFNESSADLDFRVESNDNANMLKVDGGNNRVGVGCDPSADLHVDNSSGGLIRISRNATSTANYMALESDGTNGIVKAIQQLIFSSGGNESFRSDVNRKLMTNGETAGNTGEGGLCLNQAANDDEIMTFKSSDVAHGITVQGQTDDFLHIQKVTGGNGGVEFKTFSEDQFGAYFTCCATDANTTTSASASGPFIVQPHKKDGTGIGSFSDADANLFLVANSSSINFLIKADGEIFSNQSATVGTYDTFEDAQLVRSLELSRGSTMTGLINSQFDKYIKYNHETLAEANLVGRDKDGTPNHMVNITGMQRLHNGAIWQQYEKTQRLVNAVYELAKVAVGEEKANEILKQNEIKLLN